MARSGMMLDALAPTVGGHPADVQRRILQRLLQRGADRFRARDANALPYGGFVVTGVGEDFLFRVRKLDPFVIPGDGDSSLVILHRGDQARQAHGGVRHVVSVVAAVQRRARAEHRESDARVAAVAEHQSRPLARVARAVVDHYAVGAQELPIRLDHRRNRRRAFLLLAVEEHLDVDGWLEPGGLEGVERGEEHHDRSLVVG